MATGPVEIDTEVSAGYSVRSKLNEQFRRV